MRFNIIIRSILNFRNMSEISVASGVVVDSNANHEFNENFLKAFKKFSLNSWLALLSTTTPEATDISDIFLKFKIDLIIILNLISPLNFI